MAFKLYGAKFDTFEELITALYPFFEDTMNLEEFTEFARENTEKTQN